MLWCLFNYDSAGELHRPTVQTLCANVPLHGSFIVFKQSHSIPEIVSLFKCAAGLFHEVCRNLGIDTLVCLALPHDQYIAASVLPEWTDRFQRVAGSGEVPVLSEQGKMPAWLTEKPRYGIW